jgi:hypothetical protein
MDEYRPTYVGLLVGAVEEVSHGSCRPDTDIVSAMGLLHKYFSQR